MKTKEDIIKQAEDSGKTDRIILEILLDIRELLAKQK